MIISCFFAIFSAYCNDNDPLLCIVSNNPANMTVYKTHGQRFNEYNSDENEFKCCLYSNSSYLTTNVITVHIFSKLYLIVLVHTVICYWYIIGHVEIIDFNIVELPSNMTVVPYDYTVWCVLSGNQVVIKAKVVLNVIVWSNTLDTVVPMRVKLFTIQLSIILFNLVFRGD